MQIKVYILYFFYNCQRSLYLQNCPCHPREFGIACIKKERRGVITDSDCNHGNEERNCWKTIASVPLMIIGDNIFPCTSVHACFSLPNSYSFLSHFTPDLFIFFFLSSFLWRSLFIPSLSVSLSFTFYFTYLINKNIKH